MKKEDSFWLKEKLVSFYKMRESTVLTITAILALVLTLTTDSFLTYGNITTTIIGLTVNGIIAIGMTTALVSGGFDLSVGSIVGFTGAIAGLLFLNGASIWVAAIVALIASMGIGLINGIFITKVGLNPLITTLGMMSVVRGLVYVMTKGMPLSLYKIPDTYQKIATGDIFGFPYLILILVIFVLLSRFSYQRTNIVRKIFYVGSNEEAASFSGLNIDKIKIGVYIFTAFTAGVGGLIKVAQFASAPPQMGTGIELNVIAAAVIGGASLKGGKGTVLGAIVGVLLLALIDNALILLNIPVYWQRLVSGAVLLGAVSVDQITQSE